MAQRFWHRADIGALIAALIFSGAAATAQEWDVTLSKRQAKKLTETQAQPKNWSFAISPDGAWGRAWGWTSPQQSDRDALQFCREALKPGKRDCFVYARNGVQVAGPRVPTRVIQQVYKPVDGKKARAFFGLGAVNFSGNAAAAQQHLAQGKAIAPDRAARRLLQGRSLVSAKAGGFAAWLGDPGAKHYAKSNNGVLKSHFTHWAVSKEGLLCFYGGQWSTGKQIGTRCMVLSRIADGKVQFFWDGTPNTQRNGWLVQGDATSVAVK